MEAEAAREACVLAAVESERAIGMPLDTAPLQRLGLLRFGASEHALLLTIHHIIEDGWSLKLIVDALVRCYNAPGNPLPTPPSYHRKLHLRRGQRHVLYYVRSPYFLTA